MKKKALALLLSLIMILQMAPVGTFASAADGAEMELVCTQESHTHDDSCKETVLTCTMEETTEGENPHTHEAGCFSLKLLCGKEETEGHTHSDACKESTLTCELPEDETHTHEEGCYTQSMVCGLEEIEAHTHKKDCFSYVCGKTEHQHSDGCYAAVIPADEEVEGESSEPTETTAPTETTEGGTVPETTEGETTPATTEGETVPDETQPEETTEATEEVEELSLYEQLMATETAEDMFVLLCQTEENVEAAYALTAEELEALTAHAEALPYEDEEIRTDLLDTLALLSEGALGDVETYATGTYELDSQGGYVIYRANATNVGLFTGNNYTSVSYSSSTNTIQLRGTASQSDPCVDFNIAGNNLSANTYKYAVVVYRSNKSDTTQLYGLTTSNPGASANVVQTYTVSGDGKFHYGVVDFSGSSGWSGTINGFRFDYYGNPVSAGNLYEIDSIAFCTTKETANYVGMVRANHRNGTSIKFSADDANQAMLKLFYNSHNSSATYKTVTTNNSTENAVVLTANANDYAHACYQGGGDVNMQCNSFGANASYDPQMYFHIPTGISSDYRYMVMTYKTPDDPKTDIYYDISSKFPNAVQTYANMGNRALVGIYPGSAATGGAIPEYSRLFHVYQKNTYYSNYVDMLDRNQADVINQIRIDAFNADYNKLGAELWISTIIFCKTLDEAEDIIDEELRDKYPYSYRLNYDDNVSSNDPYQVSNMPQYQLAEYYEQSTYTARIASTKPTRSNYTFKGWSVNANGSGTIYQPNSNLTMTGVKNQTKVTTLYAVWEENKATISYQIVPPSGVTASSCGTLSRSSEQVGIVNGTAQGSTVTASGSNYKFVGWYSDAACTKQVSTSTTYKPSKSGSVWSSTTYYAKFEENTATINYQIVPPSGVTASSCGTLSRTSETVKVVSGTAQGSTVTASGSNYKFVGWYSDAACTQQVSTSTTYKPSKSGSVWSSTTYYAKFEENTATISYQIVPPSGVTASSCGTLSQTSETVKVVSGTAQGSTATASSTLYKFVGWYSDAACTQQVSTSAAYTPSKSGSVWSNVTYYAKFEYNLTSMTISKTGAAYESGDVFIFDIYHGNTLVTSVTLKLNESIKISGLTVGETYTVRERTTGTRYASQADQSETLSATVSANTVTFTNSVRISNWLTVVEFIKNVFN